MATFEPVSFMVPNLAHWSNSSFLTSFVRSICRSLSVSGVRASNFLLILSELYLFPFFEVGINPFSKLEFA